MSVNEKMTNIANEIRNLSNTNEAMGLDSMASNLNTANSEIDTQADLITQIANGLEGKATGSAAIAEHNANAFSHADIREQIRQLSSEKVDVSDIVQEAGQSESLVMSQKAVTDLVAKAIDTGNGGDSTTQYETVESVEEMTDTSKQYVLKETGTIWAYGETAVEKEPENVFDKSTAKINARVGTDGMDTSTTTGSKGCFITDYIELTNWANLSEYIVRTNFELQSLTADANGVYFYDTSKTYLGGAGIIKSQSSDITVGSGASSLDIKQWGAYATAKYVRFRFYIKESGTALVTSDLDNVEITFDADAGTITENKWYDTGLRPSYQIVDSVDDMVDTSTSYILKSTGTIWTYGEKEIEVEPPNKFVPSTATLNQRLSGSSGSVSANDIAIGSFVTDFIAVSGLDKITPYNVRFNWAVNRSEDNKIVFYNSSKTRLGNSLFALPLDGSNTTISDNETVVNLKINYNGDDINVSDLSQVAYVRFQVFVKPIGTSITSDDIKNLTITFDADGGTKTKSIWYDTGMTPSANDGSDGNYVDLLVKINKNKTDIAEINNRVTAIETGNDLVTIPTFWQNAVDEVITKIKALQIGRNCITFPFFSDNHQRNGYTGMLIAHIMKECNIPYCFFGGDSISNGYIDSEETMIAQDKAFDTIMSYIPNGRFCRAVGNHDGFWNVSSATGDEYHYTRDQIYDLFLREESIAQNKHFGDDGTYYYIDDIASKTRFIIMNTNGGSVDSVQISWLQNTALSFNESGWAIVFISHQPISNHYHAGISNAAEVRAVVSNYINGASANKADIVGWFSGHIHRDRIYTGVAVNTSNDNVGEAMGFTQVTITSDHTSIAYDDATKHTVAADDQSHAIDFVTINKNTGKVNLTRLGVGNDRSYTYSKNGNETKYTNLANPSGDGWSNDSRLGSDGAIKTGVTGVVVTNYIPFNTGDIIRIKGMDLTTYNCAIYNGNKVNQSAAALKTQTNFFGDISATTSGGQFTVTTTANSGITWYVRFSGSPTTSANDIIITRNETID